METRAQYTLVGSVVIGIVTFIAVTVLWLTNIDDEAHQNLYTIYFKQFSLSGLQINSSVTMRGIRVGSVESLQISRRDIELVKVTIRVQSDTPIKTDTVAVVERNLLTGLASIDLNGSSQEAPYLLETSDEDYPVIPEGKTSLAAIQEGLPQLFERSSQLITRLNTIFSPENTAALSKTVSNVQELTGALAEKKLEISKTIQNLDSATEKANGVLQELDAKVAELTSSIARAADIVSNETSRMGQSVAAASESLNTTLESYEEPRSIFSGPAKSAFGPGE